MLSRSQILGAKLRQHSVNVPEWGGDVCLQEQSVGTRVALLETVRKNSDEVEAYLADQALPEGKRKGVAKADKLDYAVLTLIHSIVDERGDLMFGLADYDALRGLSFKTTSRLWNGVTELNSSATADAVEAEKKD